MGDGEELDDDDGGIWRDVASASGEEVVDNVEEFEMSGSPRVSIAVDQAQQDTANAPSAGNGGCAADEADWELVEPPDEISMREIWTPWYRRGLMRMVILVAAFVMAAVLSISWKLAQEPTVINRMVLGHDKLLPSPVLAQPDAHPPSLDTSPLPLQLDVPAQRLSDVRDPAHMQLRHVEGQKRAVEERIVVGVALEADLPSVKITEMSRSLQLPSKPEMVCNISLTIEGIVVIEHHALHLEDCWEHVAPIAAVAAAAIGSMIVFCCMRTSDAPNAATEADLQAEVKMRDEVEAESSLREVANASLPAGTSAGEQAMHDDKDDSDAISSLADSPGSVRSRRSISTRAPHTPRSVSSAQSSRVSSRYDLRSAHTPRQHLL